MRKTYLLSLSLAAALAGCYNPNLAAPGYFCDPNDAWCPEGTECKLSGGDYHCVKPEGGGGGGGGGGGALDIPKTGAAYNGAKQDPGLDTAADCTDAPLESNNSPSNATDISSSVAINGGGSWIQMQAICPAGKKDVDFFLVDTSAAPQSTIYLKAEIQYDIQFGDLDVAIVDNEGSIMASDGTAKTNGCTVANIGNGKFYVGVVGADGAVNNYQVRVRAYSTPQSCN